LQVPLILIAAADPKQAITPLYTLTPSGQHTFLPLGVAQDRAGTSGSPTGTLNSIDRRPRPASSWVPA
jgi:hypothetical protein